MINKLIIRVVCIIAFINIFAIQANASPVIRWGLHHEKPGEIPIGNASSDYLESYNAFFYGKSQGNEKVLFLTFDAGYENGHTEKILDVLKEKNVPASFFLVGNYLKEHPDIVKRKVEEGHIIGNHTMSHADMSKKDPESFASELRKFEEAYKDVVGLELKKYYRPPEGVFNESNLSTTNSIGYKTVLWSVAYADWDNKKQPSREYAFEKLIPRLHDGAILLLHSTSRTNAEILPEFIDKCHEMGYSFKSLDEI